MRFYISPTGEIIEPCAHEGTEVPIEQRFTAAFVAALREYDPAAEPNPPEREPPPVPAPTADEVLAQRDALLAVAALRIAPLQDAVDLDVETGDEVAALTEWKQYRVDLNRIELQADFPDAIEWPVAPT